MESQSNRNASAMSRPTVITNERGSALGSDMSQSGLLKSPGKKGKTDDALATECKSNFVLISSLFARCICNSVTDLLLNITSL